MVITYQTYVVRTPHHTILVDTCTGEDKGYPAPMDFPKQPWLDGLKAEGLSFDDIDYVFCTHLHIDHCGLEHGAARRALGADLPEGEVRLPQARIRGLGGHDQGRGDAPRRRRQCLPLQLRTDRRGRPGAAGR